MRINIISQDKIFSRLLECELKRRKYDATVSSSKNGASVVICDLDTDVSDLTVPSITFSFDGNSDLVRPFSIDDLVALLESKRINSSAKKAMSQHITVFEGDSYTLRIDDTAVAMTKQEYLLFELLYENAGKTVSKKEIFDRVWNGLGNDNKLRVYIKYVREKTEPIYKKRIIFSVRDRGYLIKFD